VAENYGPVRLADATDGCAQNVADSGIGTPASQYVLKQIAVKAPRRHRLRSPEIGEPWRLAQEMSWHCHRPVSPVLAEAPFRLIGGH
jgi:hypothetical protein